MGDRFDGPIRCRRVVVQFMPNIVDQQPEFIVVVCGEIMTMPGLPRVPAADSIKLNEKGEIEGLF